MKKIALALAAVLILSACGKEAPTPQTVTLTLDSNPTTGFSWQVEQSEELFRLESVYTEDRTGEPVTGSGGTETITLTPLKAGKTEVTLTYARPWEGGEKGDQLVYAFEIDKNMQVQMTDAYSMGSNEPITTPAPEIK